MAGCAPGGRDAPYAVYAALDVALLPIVAGILLRVLLKSGNKRNLPLISILVLMSLANLVFHLPRWVDRPASHAAVCRLGV